MPANSTFYPLRYRGADQIQLQIMVLAGLFGLDPRMALAYVARGLPKLPQGAEGWFAVPTVSAAARGFNGSSSGQHNVGSYENALAVLVKRLIESGCSFISHTFDDALGSVVPIRISEHTTRALDVLGGVQQGDILIVPAQLGARYAGRSVREARQRFTENEFGLTTLQVGAILLTHPERFSHYPTLGMDCAGDEAGDKGLAENGFVPYFSLKDAGEGTKLVDVDVLREEDVAGDSGAVTGFLLD